MNDKKQEKRDENLQTKLKKLLKNTATFFGDLFFPDKIKCMFCSEEVLDFENQPYCSSCAEKLAFNNGKRCVICDVPLESEAVICDHCQNHHRSFKKAFCPFLYEGLIKNSILAYKDDNKRYLATGFSHIIAKRIQSEGVKIDLITFVPMTKEKEYERTFNQSRLLAEKIGKILDVPVLPLFEKLRDTTEQKTLSYKQRQENTKGSYALIKANARNLENVLIVDDVITTCATIDACAKLLEKKAKNVYVCAIARQYVRPAQPIVINHLPYQTFSFEE